MGLAVTLTCLCLGFGALTALAQTTSADIPLVRLEVPIGSVVEVDGIAEYVSVFYRFAVSAMAIIAATMIMYAGISWLTAAGNSTKTGEAKERIIAAISGLILTMMSFVILNTINPQLVELQNPEVSISIIPDSISSLFDGSSSSSVPIVSAGSGLGATIVQKAQEYAASDNLQHDCCWGWTSAIYDLSGAKTSINAYRKANMNNCAACNWDNASGFCKSGGVPSQYNTAANTSRCTDGDVPYAELQPGDWIYMFNGNRYETGEHSLIFLYWTNEANHEAMCASAPGSGTTASVHACSFAVTPVTRIMHPSPTSTRKSNPGKCG